jgi:hypothetical protein
MITELEDWDADRLDGVGNPANGINQFLVLKASGEWDVSKRTFTAEERRSMAAEGKALPDGAFPIANRADLQNAIDSIGRTTKPKGKVKSYIKGRAKALDATNLIPDSWKEKTMTKAEKGLGEAGDGRGLLDLGATLSAVQEGIAAIQTSLSEMKGSDQLGDAQTDPDPAVAKMQALLKEGESIKKAAEKAMEATQGKIGTEITDSSNTEAGEGSDRDLAVQTSLKKLDKKFRKFRKRTEKANIGKAKREKNERGEFKSQKDKAFRKAKFDGYGKKNVKKSESLPPLTNGLALAVQAGSPSASLNTSPAQEIRKAVRGMDQNEAFHITRDSTNAALRPIIATLGPVPPGREREMI